MTQEFGLSVLPQPVPVSEPALRLIMRGVAELWRRIETATPAANERPLLLSYDVHPTSEGPVLIEVNTNAGGVMTAMQTARTINRCCVDWEQAQLQARLIQLFRRDLLDVSRRGQGLLVIADDQLETQTLLPEMQGMAQLLQHEVDEARVVEAAELQFREGRLWHHGAVVDYVYWRSTDFLLQDAAHTAVRSAVAAGAVRLAPSAAAYAAIADKRRLVEWSRQPELARDELGNLTFRLAETVPMNTRSAEDWYAERRDWVFKPVSGFASRGVYVGKSISRQKLATLPADDYLAQRYAPHPVVDRDGSEWKYDVRFYADRGEVIGAAARVFQGQVVGLRAPGSGFAPIKIDTACCLIGALVQARR